MGPKILKECDLPIQTAFCTLVILLVVFSGCGNMSQDSDCLNDSYAIIPIPTATPMGTKEFIIEYDIGISNFYRIEAIPFDSNLQTDTSFIDSSDLGGILDDSGRRKVRIRVDANVKYLIKFYTTQLQFDNDEPIDTTEYINTVIK